MSKKDHVYLTYGTISKKGVRQLLKDIPLSANDVFYDLGSGIGNVCMQVFQESRVKKCVGIEYDIERHNHALEDAREASDVSDVSDVSKRETGRDLQFRNENFMQSDISDATVLFTDSIMFSLKTLRQLETKVRASCPNLRYFVSMRKLPKSTALSYNHMRYVPASWGKSHYYVYATRVDGGDRRSRRIRRSRTPVHTKTHRL
jgi:hypothetical protein